MDIQLGRSKTVRRAYGIDEIALVPGGRTVDPEVTNTSWSLGGITREIPIIASAMDGVVDVDMAVRLSELGALGVLNLEGVQTRYEDPNEVLDRIAAVGKTEFVPLMQEIYSQPVQEQLIRKRIQDIKAQGGIAAVSGTPVAAMRFRKAIAEAGADLFFAVDIEERSLEVPQINLAINFELEDSVKERFLKGLDDIGITLDHSEAIKNFENTRAVSYTHLTLPTNREV